MIPVERAELPEPTARQMLVLRGRIEERAAADRPRRARALWSGNKAIRSTVDSRLRDMAHGRDRCMYCGDNEGATVDHYEPVARAPLRTFDWLNHLLACSVCNSHKKRDRFPVDVDGCPLLIDPSHDDPFDHLVLSLSTGVYRPRTPRGEATIEVCDLNRPILARGRIQARRVVVHALRSWRDARAAGDARRLREAELTVREEPFADVCQSMLRHAASAQAHVLFSESADVLHVLRDPDVRETLLISRT